MAEKKDEPHIVMLKGVRVNMFNDQLYFPEAELTTKGKKKGCFRFNWSSKFIFPKKDTPEGKDLLAKAKATSDPAERTKLYEEAQVIFKDQAPWATLAHSTQYVPMAKNVEGFVMSPLGDFTFETVDLTE